MNILRVEGAELDGIHYLRAFGNSDSIRRDAEAAERIVLVGGSYIACEVAASLRALGKEVAIVCMEDVVLSRGFGEEVGRWFQQLLQSKGVEVTEYDITMGGPKRQEMLARAPGRNTVPQIFIDDRHIGGSDDLAALDRAGGLDPLLAQTAS